MIQTHQIQDRPSKFAANGEENWFQWGYGLTAQQPAEQPQWAIAAHQFQQPTQPLVPLCWHLQCSVQSVLCMHNYGLGKAGAAWKVKCVPHILWAWETEHFCRIFWAQKCAWIQDPMEGPGWGLSLSLTTGGKLRKKRNSKDHCLDEERKYYI